MKKFWRWASKHALAICGVAGIVLLIIDMYCTALLIRGELPDDSLVYYVISMIFAEAYAVLMVVLIRLDEYDKFSTAVSEETNQLYFHGFKLWRWVDNDAFVRLQNWSDSEFTYELAILAMFALKRSKSAVLYRGDLYDEKGDFKSFYSWVEFKIPGKGRYIADFSREGAFFRKDEYTKCLGGSLVPRWACSHATFWSLEYVQAVYSAAKSQKHSHLMLELRNFVGFNIRKYYLPKRCQASKLKYSDGSYMLPFTTPSGKEISSIVIRDFVKNDRREQPRARTIRLTHCGMKRYKEWCARHATQPN